MGSKFSVLGTIFGQLAEVDANSEKGFVNASKSFRDDIPANLVGRVYMVTGANSGIGYVLCRDLIRRSACVHMICRSLPRGEEARKKLMEEVDGVAPANLVLHIVDISNLADVRRFAREWIAHNERLDALVHNAGAMPIKRETTSEGHETTLAAAVLGPHVLTRELEPLIRKSATRVIWVTSSAIYSLALDLKDPEYTREPFDGTVAYAHAKRWQVTLMGEWAKKLGADAMSVAMHPGWVKTPGVAPLMVADPAFKALEPGFRTPEHGADTAMWLATTATPIVSGRLYFDRKEVAPNVKLAGTQPSEADCKALWETVEGMCHPISPPPPQG